jgi:ankyrin repeat protein
VDLLDDGDIDGLGQHLAGYPDLIRQRVTFEGSNYFREPGLLEFIAENPVRHDSLPPNIVEVARTILDAGAHSDVLAIDSTLGLVCSGRVARECGVQIPLIDLLCDYGAIPSHALPAALAHGEFEAADALIRRGAPVDLVAAAALGRAEVALQGLPAASGMERHQALALSAQHGHAHIVRMLLKAGEDPNRYNPIGFHAHSTPLHQAALAGHVDVVRAHLEAGARPDIRDIHFQGTAYEWAKHGGQTEISDYLAGFTPSSPA